MQSLQRQREIYINGLAGRIPKIPLSFAGLEQRALQILSKNAFAYLAGGAGRETTIDNNRHALDQIKIHPSVLGGVQEVSMQLKWREHTLPAPFMLAPIGVLELAHREGDKEAARAAAATGIPMIISNQASFPIEDIAVQLKASPRLFQLYYSKSQELSKSFIRRAEAVGCSALVVTLDTTMLGWRVRDLNLGYSPFLFGLGIAQYYSDPVFNQLPDPIEQTSLRPPLTLTFIKSIISLNNRIPGGFWKNLQSNHAMKTVRKFTSIFNNSGMNWDDISRIREWTRLPIYLKGILRPDDAIKAVQAGIDGIIVSNHGGRQIDHGLGSMDTLPEIVQAVNGKARIIVDGGVQRGTDILKAVALGADVVALGRLQGWGLAAGGKDGVVRMLEILEDELICAMGLIGVTSMDQVTPQYVCKAEPVTLPHEMSAWVNMRVGRIH